MDRRIVKSRRAIQEAFLSLLSEEDFDAITVKEITERADISRKTFYLHYVDKYDLLDAIINILIAELDKICEQKKEMGMVEGTILWFRYFEQNQVFFASLFRSASTVSFRKLLLEFMEEQLRRKLSPVGSPPPDEVVVRFLGMAVLGVMESFVLNTIEGTTEEIAGKVGLLLEQAIAASDGRE